MASKSVSAVRMRDSQKVWSILIGANALRMYRKFTLSRMRKSNFSENMAPFKRLLVLVLVSCRFFQPFWIFVLSKTIFSVNKDQGTKFSLRVTRISAKHPDLAFRVKYDCNKHNKEGNRPDHQKHRGLPEFSCNAFSG
jgi:hypothetical protein